MTYHKIMERMHTGGVVILDGATGTELEKRGAEMNAEAWCGPANLYHRQLLEQVHFDYIRAGAEIITTNTFATSRLMLEAAGFAEQIDEIYHNACAATHDARDRSGRSDVLIAGSLAHMIPVSHGDPLNADPYIGMGRDAFAASLHEAAGLLKQGGCDLILLEMMYRPGRIELALEAALATGLPVWVGFSARQSSNGDIVAHVHEQDIPFADIVALLPDQGIDAAGVMHSNVNLTGPALELLRKKFAGPLLAYPDSGYFRMPHWQFEDVIPPAELKAVAEKWVTAGVSVIGGCCGLSIEHVRALASLSC